MARVPSTWFFVTPNTIQQFAVKDVLYFGRSEYQTVEVIETVSYGKCLILDGKIQSCEKDELLIEKLAGEHYGKEYDTVYLGEWDCPDCDREIEIDELQ